MTITLIVLFILLNIADIILTNRIISKGGKELNFIMAWCMERFGWFWWIPKMVLIMVVILALYYIPAMFKIPLMILLVCGYVWVIIHNIKELR